MAEKVTPMIHVPDVRATSDWYEDIGFTVVQTYGNECGGLSFAILSFGSSEVMFNQGGEPGTSRRREVDLYVSTDKVDDLYLRLKDRVEVREGPHDTFYGMREFIIRDLNGFWITFAQTSVFQLLQTGVREGNTEAVRAAIERGLKPETLTAALVLASSADNKSDADKNAEIRELLKQAGAVPPPEVEAKILQSYVGKYSTREFEINIILRNGRLLAAQGLQQPLGLLAINRNTFRPVSFEDFGTFTFNVEAGKTVGCALNHGGITKHLARVEETNRP